jgi:hypothetical protein
MSLPLSVKEESGKQEKEIAKDIGGQTIVASGALPHAKGDVNTPFEKLEIKYTRNKTYTVRVLDLTRLRGQSFRNRLRIPVFIFEYRTTGDRFAITFEKHDALVETNIHGRESFSRKLEDLLELRKRAADTDLPLEKIIISEKLVVNLWDYQTWKSRLNG